MGSLSNRNTEIMIAESQRMHAEVEELRQMIKAQNLKITTLSNELTELKRVQVMSLVQMQQALKGNGGTV